MIYWIRCGDQGDYQAVDDLDAAIEFLNELKAGEVTGWVEGARGVGLETTNFWGCDFVSLFVGDPAANLIRPLNAWERGPVEAGVEAVYN